MVFQHFELYPHLSVLDNICLAPVHVLKRNREEAVVKAQDLLQRVGLLDKQQSYPAQLSGGQQQRIAIVSALAMDPIAMLFDEPTRSEEHTSELQSLMRISYAVFCLPIKHLTLHHF